MSMEEKTWFRMRCVCICVPWAGPHLEERTLIARRPPSLSTIRGGALITGPRDLMVFEYVVCSMALA